MKNHFLLDDGKDQATQDKEWDDLARLVRQESYKQLLALKNTMRATAVASRVSTPNPAKPENKVFSSRPTLHEMMQQYNARPSHTSGLIRPQTEAAKARTSIAFQSDRIAHYQVPGLKGRILRPAR